MCYTCRNSIYAVFNWGMFFALKKKSQLFVRYSNIISRA